MVDHLLKSHPNILLADVRLIVQNAVYHKLYLIAFGLAVCEPFQYFGQHIYLPLSARKGEITEEEDALKRGMVSDDLNLLQSHLSWENSVPVDPPHLHLP